jgi:hypothetical protein
VRRRAGRPTLDTVFVFGAGASYDASKALNPSAAHTAPLDKEFCARIKLLTTSNACPEWVRRSTEMMLASWRDTKPFEKCGLEEAVLLQTAHLNFLNVIQPRRVRFTLRTEWDFVYHLSHIVAYILRQCREKPSSPFRRFARRFFAGRDAARINNRVITFNYDILFDRHLLLRFGPKETYFEEMGTGSGVGNANPLLLKLHGSANWFIDEEEYDRAFSRQNASETPYTISRVGLITGMSPAIDHLRSPLIIPPVPNKPITTISLFTSLWSRASEYLEGARHIVICGYSLPETDIMARALFKNVRNPEVVDISVVDPDGATMGKWKGLLDGNVNKNVRWHYFASFSEYVAQSCS